MFLGKVVSVCNTYCYLESFVVVVQWDIFNKMIIVLCFSVICFFLEYQFFLFVFFEFFQRFREIVLVFFIDCLIFIWYFLIKIVLFITLFFSLLFLSNFFRILSLNQGFLYFFRGIRIFVDLFFCQKFYQNFCSLEKVLLFFLGCFRNLVFILFKNKEFIFLVSRCQERVCRFVYIQFDILFFSWGDRVV